MRETLEGVSSKKSLEVDDGRREDFGMIYSYGVALTETFLT